MAALFASLQQALFPLDGPWCTRKFLPEQVVEVQSGGDSYYCMILEADETGGEQGDVLLFVDYVGGKR